MASFEISWKISAAKELKRLPKNKISKIIKIVESLTINPFPSGVKKLSGSEHTYRLRVGDYRIIYDVYHNQLIIEIVRVRHRKDVYK